MGKTFFRKCGLRFCLAGGVMLMLLATSVSLRANPTQDRNVTGLVTSATDGEPVIGASVQVKGTGKGTITDLNGRYTVSAAPGQTLVFSYVGFKTQEIKVGQQTPLNVVLTEDSELLEEVVVVGYGSMKRSDLTGSVTSVGSTAIEKSVPTSIDQVLQGTRSRCADPGRYRSARR